MSDIERPYFAKWPELRIEGDPVHPEQAAEIILRCLGWYVGGNDHAFQRAVWTTLGVEVDEHGFERLDSMQRFRERIDALDLEYLNLGGRILTAYIGGPHGWLDWDGTVGTVGHAIGKWPEAEEIDEDLTALAEAFPFLRMRVQVMPERDGDEPLGRFAEWRVADGVISPQEPGEPIVGTPRASAEQEALWLVRGLVQGTYRVRERGCTIAQLAEAYVLTLQAKRVRDGAS